MPLVPPVEPTPTQESIERERREIDSNRALQAVMFATADRLGIPRAMFVREVKAIYRRL